MKPLGKQFSIFYLANMWCESIKCSLTRRPKTRHGSNNIHNMLKKDTKNFRQVYRMYLDEFLKLRNIIRGKTHLPDARCICIACNILTHNWSKCMILLDSSKI